MERGELLIGDDGRIAHVGARGSAACPPGCETLDLEGHVLLPGFCQAHVHLCQTLFRNQADDLPLLPWLRERIWPFEAAHDPASLAASAELGIAELLRGGTTSVLDMGTVRHTEVLFEVAERTGIRAVIGKCHMDVDSGQPRALFEQTHASVAEAKALARRWHGAAGGRLHYGFAPRFVLSCTERLLREVAEAARAIGARLHTHASEQKPECALVRERTGMDNIAYLHAIGFAGPDTVYAHGVQATDDEIAQMARSGTHLAHCPSSNLKLGSGIARIPAMLEAGVNVAIGADGAPCNNNLDALLEARLAALLHKPRYGADALPAERVLAMACRGGAAALGLEHEVGRLAPGMRADVISIDLRDPSNVPLARPEAAIIYAASSRQVRNVWVDGEPLLRDGELVRLDAAEVAARANEQWRAVCARAETTSR
ncbi:MAG: N-ethylammeline chlorohydrolase [Planctomycetota bacterium]|nr:MAG: N-ethylammeline chlorohydrolase [Planctomycetota bacterium]